MPKWIRPGRMRPETKHFLMAAVICVLVFAILMVIICDTADIGIGEYYWPTYRLQAQAWLRGETALDQDYPALELAIYEGKYYVSFPPVPSIPYLILIPIFGDSVSGGILQKLYMLLACLLILSEIMRSKKMRFGEYITWTVGFCFASAMLPILPVGGVWFEAEILAFLFSAGSLIALRKGGITRACILWALSIGCRPFTICMGPVLLMVYIRKYRKNGDAVGSLIRRALPGITAGLLIAGAYMWYNAVRFGDPLEFGHNYLPEFTRSENGQFSLVYVIENLKTMFFGSPISEITSRAVEFNVFGFSMFISCPILLIGIIWVVSDIVRRKMTVVKWTIVAMAAVNIFLLAMHKTVGGWQFGLRYALELVPMCFAWYLESPDRNAMKGYEMSLLTFGLILNTIGAVMLYM